MRSEVKPTRSWLRRLDHLPPGLALTSGLAAGALAGAALAAGQPAVAAVAFVALLGGAAVLAWSGEPVAVLEDVPEPEPPKRPSLVELVPIPAGSFRMGSPDDEKGRWDGEGPVHEVRVSAFECMRVPVTRRIYAEVTGKEGPADERPVNNVTWFDAVRFCNRLSEREELTPCYAIEDEDVSWVPDADGYRLPTEAEWEYACRAGSQTRWSFGDDEEKLAGHGWYRANSDRKRQPVGGLKPNAWGLHDMHGNVYEWCWDRYGPYGPEPQTDPAGPPDGRSRVLRGGSFAVWPRDLRSADRDGVVPEGRDVYVGFRCVRVRLRQP